MKFTTLYKCQNCNETTNKWTGKCPFCSAWNSIIEMEQETSQRKISKTGREIHAQKTEKLNLNDSVFERLETGIEEFDRTIGGGIVKGSMILLSGEPGIGKSTLTLQIAEKISKKNKVLLISAEESISQISDRAKRLNINENNLSASNIFELEQIIETIKSEKPDLAIIDSIQVIFSPELPSIAGSQNQVKYCSEILTEFAKKNNIPLILIGHVTKDGNIAGPKLLEHIVDTVIQFEGDRYQNLRILRAIKNRFGSCTEVGIFEMSELGLKEVKNPSAQFLEGRKENAIGSVITPIIEGNRAILIEVQALTSTTHFGYPKRTSNGYDLNRLQILIAVLEKYAKMDLMTNDVFINIVGGIKIKDTSADLAVLTAIASSYFKKPAPKNSVIYGEVGLSGELRKVTHNDKRESESQKQDFMSLINPISHKDINQVLRLFE